MKLKIPVFYLLLFILPCRAQNEIPDPDPLRFQSEISAFTEWDQKNSTPKNAMLFVGSSSIRMWKTHDAFPDRPVINRGFGGAHISDMLFYYDRILQPYDADIIVFYCGDNDIAAGKTPDRVFHDYVMLVNKILNDKPDVKLVCLDIKPSVSRWEHWENMKTANQMIRMFNDQNSRLFTLDTATPLLDINDQPNPDLLLEDGLHLNDSGYAIWNEALRQFVISIE